MRVEYEVDKDRMNKFLDYIYTSGELSMYGYESCVVVLGYIIDNSLVNYSFDILGNLCRGKFRCCSPIAIKVADLDEYYLEKPLNIPLTDKSIRWLKVGIDFMLENCKEYIPIGILKSKMIIYEEENKAIKEYVINNKDEFPDVYLDLLL